MENKELDQTPGAERQIDRLAIGVNVLLQILIAIAIVAMVNYVSIRHYWRGDYSRNQRYTLSALTKNVLSRLEAPVNVTVFVPQTYGIYEDIASLMKEYEYAAKKNFSVEFVDPYRNISRAKAIVEKYKAGANEAIVIVDYKGKSKFVGGPEMAELDKSGVEFGQQPTIKSFKGEEMITSAIIEVTEEKQNKVYFLTGHGEFEIAGADLAAFRQYVGRENINTQPLVLNNEPAVPNDASAVCILGAKSDLSEREIQLLNEYWATRKGRLLVLLNPIGKTGRLVEWLQEQGVKPMADRVVCTMSLPDAIGLIPATGVFLPSAKPIVRDLSGMNIVFLGSAESLTMDRTKQQTDKIRLIEVVEADEHFWGETDLDEAGNPTSPVFFSPKRDHMAPLTMAAGVEKGGLDDPRVKVETSRMVVVGNAAFLTTDGLRQSNVGLDFALNSLNWILNREHLVGIAPKARAQVRLSLDERQLGSIFLLTVCAIPLAIGLIGLYVTWIRQGWSLLYLTASLIIGGICVIGGGSFVKWALMRH
jgi:hypothetical protein